MRGQVRARQQGEQGSGQQELGVQGQLGLEGQAEERPGEGRVQAESISEEQLLKCPESPREGHVSRANVHG